MENLKICAFRFCYPRIAILIVFLIAAQPGECLQKTVHFLFSGNWKGRVATWNDREVVPTALWKLPDLLAGASRRSAFSLKCFVGNQFSVKHPASLLMMGKLEESLLKNCQFEVKGLGPDDFSLFRGIEAFSSNLFQRIWTNVEYSLPVKQFLSRQIVVKGKQKVGICCLISPEYLATSPVNNWEGYRIDDVARTVRRVLSAKPDVDYYVWIGHLSKTDLFRVQKAMGKQDRILWVPNGEGAKELATDIRLGKVPRIWCLETGETKLLSIKTELRDGGRQIEQINRLDLSEGEKVQVNKEFKKFAGELQRKLFHTLRVVNFSDKSENLLFRFSETIHARLVRKFMRSDFSLLALPPEEYQNSRIVSVNTVFRTVPCHDLREYSLSGADLEAILEGLYRSHLAYVLSMSGGEAAFLGDQNIRVFFREREVDYKKIFTVTLNETLFNDEKVQEILAKGEKPYLLKNSREMRRVPSARPRGMRDANFLPWMALCREAQDGRERLLRIPKGGACPPLLKSYEKPAKCGWTIWDAWLSELEKLPIDVPIWQDD